MRSVHLTNKSENILEYDHIRRHNDFFCCYVIIMKFKSTKLMEWHSIQEIIINENAEIKVYNGIWITIVDHSHIIVLNNK